MQRPDEMDGRLKLKTQNYISRREKMLLLLLEEGNKSRPFLCLPERVAT